MILKLKNLIKFLVYDHDTRRIAKRLGASERPPSAWVRLLKVIRG